MIRIAEENKLAQWQELPFFKKLEVVDSWTIVIIAGNFCHILGLIFFVLPDEVVSVTYETQLIGIGTFLIYLSLMKYL